MKNDYPIFIICRDRLSCTLQLLDWLEGAGHQRIYLIDNDSTWGPLLEYYETTSHTVIRLSGNGGHTAPWRAGIVEEVAKDEFFVVSDPDIVPIKECPLDAVEYFRYLLDKYPQRTKAGFGLKIDDIPDYYQHREAVIRHESQYHSWVGPEPNTLFAPIDTTFALYRPHADSDISFSIRTMEPYLARHLPWYLDLNNLDEEEAHYKQYASSNINSWNQDVAPGWS